MKPELLPVRRAMELLGWSIRQEGDQLVAHCCGNQVAAMMPKDPRLQEPIELHCNQCGARVMPASWAGVRLSAQERQEAVESGAFWLAVPSGAHETTLRMAARNYRLVALRDPTEGRWHGHLWRDGEEIHTYADQITLGPRDITGLDQVKRVLCVRAHEDAGEQEHVCDENCWRPPVQHESA